MIEFFLKWKDKYCNIGTYPGQCVNVVKAYFSEVLGLTPFTGNAIDYWNNPPQGFEKISKTLFNRPNPGDIVIWGTSYNPIYGHIAICNWSRFYDIGVFEQNNPVGSTCHYSDRNYKGVLGWLRPIHRATLDIAIVNGTKTFISKINEYLKGEADFKIKDYYDVLDSRPDGMALIDKLGIKERFVFINYNADNAYASTSIYPNSHAFCLIPRGNPDTIPVHEFLHMMRKYINSNHLGYIEDVERYPTNWSDLGNFNNEGWQFQTQYNELIPYLRKL